MRNVPNACGKRPQCRHLPAHGLEVRRFAQHARELVPLHAQHHSAAGVAGKLSHSDMHRLQHVRVVMGDEVVRHAAADCQRVVEPLVPLDELLHRQRGAAVERGAREHRLEHLEGAGVGVGERALEAGSGALLVSTDGALAGVDIERGQIAWQKPELGGLPPDSVRMVEGSLLMEAAKPGLSLIFDPVTGTVLFTPHSRSGFVTREQEVYDSFGRRFCY